MRHLLAIAICVAPTFAQLDYNADILPILSRRCFACHGPDGDSREADMRLDTFDGATAERGRRGAAIVAGHPDRSLMLERITDDEDPMPPEGERLTTSEIATLRQWITEGATYDEPWSWKPVRDPEPPALDDAWIRNDVDRFILDRLRGSDVEPAPEASDLALIRRVTYDLTGLPPTPEEIDAYLDDEGPGRYERVVDRLLASPHYGEHWGRHWLDLMRYAESHGHEFDYPIHHAWRYRDYVIRAFNDDLPYDRFVREHIAGDTLEPRLHPTEGYNESVLGTGWWWLSQGTHAPVDVRLDEAERVDNQIDVLSKTFLSVTVSCARCHDHKFDQISTKDYYGFYGFVQSSRRDVAYLDPGSEIERAIDALRPVDEALRTRTSAALSTGFEREFRAMSAVLFGEPRPGETHPEPRSLFDFESGTFEGWSVEGSAFGPIPKTQETVGPYQGEIGAPSMFFANSHLAGEGTAVGAADDHLGTLTSAPFTIDRPWLQFHVGGGRHPGKTGMHLVVDGEVVRSVTGHDSNRMRQESWNVREFMGREAHLVIFDQQKGHWGHINIDDVVLDTRHHDQAGRRPVEAVASEHGVDASRLATWVDAFGATPTDPAHPLHALRHGGVEPKDKAPDLLERMPPADWMPSGFAFDVPTRANAMDARTAIERGEVRVLESHQIHSGVLDERLQGTLRSPDFELTHRRLHYRVRGKGVIRLIIDGYWLDEFNALLFGGIRFEVDAKDWETHTQHLDLFLGETAHIEIIDDGDGSLVVDRVWFGDDVSPRVHPINAEAPASREEIDTYYEAIFAEPEATPAIADWLTSNGLAGDLEDDARASIDVPRPMRALAICEGDPQDERVFIRGGHRTLGDPAPRSFIDSIAGETQPRLRSASGRPELAERMLDERNPLLTRSIVNRVWHHLFGRGLCASVDDFGALGTMPTHPDLLDHLAHGFRHDMDWSIKTLIRDLVTSSTYRMASTHPDDSLATTDPLNGLFHRQNQRRLSAESIRDALFVVSGTLDPTLYGESIPLHLTPFLTGRGRPEGGPLDGRRRRSIYISIRRNFLSPMMLAFDMPVPQSTVGKRNVSNVPAQSLIMMNHPLVMDRATHFAHAAGEEATDASARTHMMYRRALGRPPTDEEVADAIAFVELQTEAYEGDDTRAWADFAHVLFNLKEFIFID